MALKTRGDIQNWLRNQPKVVEIVFAARAALRAVPFYRYFESFQQPFSGTSSTLILPSFYGLATALSAGTWPDRTEDKHSASASASAATAADASAAAESKYAFYATYAAFYASAASVTSGSGNTYTFSSSVPNPAFAPTPTLAFPSVLNTSPTSPSAISLTSASANAAYWAASAAATDAARDAARDAYWTAFNDDHDHIAGDGTARSLANQPLWAGGWDGAPKAVQANWEALKKSLKAMQQNWDVWINWYDNRINGVSLDGQADLEIAKLDYLTDQYDGEAKAFKTPTADINAELQRLTDEFWEGQNDIEGDSLPANSQVQAVYTFASKDGVIHARLSRQSPSQQQAEEARKRLLDICRKSLLSFKENMADEAIIRNIRTIISDLDHDINDFSAASLDMSMSMISALSAMYLKPGYESNPLIGGLLLGISNSGDKFLGYFEDLKHIEAERLALKMQSADANVIEGYLQDAIEIIEASGKASEETIVALKDGQELIKELNMRVAQVGDNIGSDLILERGRVVSLRVLTYMNFLLATIEADKQEEDEEKPNEFGEVVKDGMKEGLKELAKDATKGGFKHLKDKLAGNVGNLAKHIPKLLELLKHFGGG